MKDIKSDVDEHNKRKVEDQKRREDIRRKDELILKSYSKYLPDDPDAIGTQAQVLYRTGNFSDCLLGCLLIKAHFVIAHGDFNHWLDSKGINRRKAYRVMADVRAIRQIDFKAFTSKPLQLEQLPEGEIIDADDDGLIEKLESGEATPKDFARRSPVDVKKMLARIEKLEAELKQKTAEAACLQGEIDIINLGTIEDRKIRDWIGKWQLAFIGGRNRLLNLKKDISDQTQMDVYTALQWFGHQTLLLESAFAARYPKYDTYSQQDRAEVTNWLQEHGRDGKSFMVPEGGELPLTEIKHSTTGDTGNTGKCNPRSSAKSADKK